MENSYNGYKNYPTWAIALWLNNDPGLYGWLQEQKEQSPEAHELADSIKGFFEELYEADMEALSSVFRDLLQNSLGSVDWHEIAENELAD